MIFLYLACITTIGLFSMYLLASMLSDGRSLHQSLHDEFAGEQLVLFH